MFDDTLRLPSYPPLEAGGLLFSNHQLSSQTIGKRQMETWATSSTGQSFLLFHIDRIEQRIRITSANLCRRGGLGGKQTSRRMCWRTKWRDVAADPGGL